MRRIASWRKAIRFVIARSEATWRPERETRGSALGVQSRRTRPDNRVVIGEIATAFPRLHPKGTSSRFALRAPRPLWGLAMANLKASRRRMRAAKIASLQGAH